MSKGNTRKTKKGNSREIKQVFLSEDGKKETSVTSAVIKQDPKAVQKHDPMAGQKRVTKPGQDQASKSGTNHEIKHEIKHEIRHEENAKSDEEKHAHHVSDANRTVRIIAVAVAMFFSLLLSMAVGIGLALWDSNRTIADLTTIVFARELPPKVSETQLANKEGATKSNELDDVPGDGDKKGIAEDKKEEPKEEPKEEVKAEPDDYGSTIGSDTNGLDSLSKAGSGDEIVGPDDTVAPAALDPTADYPLEFTTVDESYFTDALFIGDSRLQGFGFWSGLPATYYCATGFQLYKFDTADVVQTENGKVPIFEAMPYDAFTKIYIKVGLNELGFGTEENFEKNYAALIEKLREYEPRAVIYVHGILPVTAAKSQKDKAHNNPNIVKRNESLEKFAKEQKAYYLDAGPALADEDGNLKPEMTSDGIHLKPEYMKLWREYLCEHAIVIR